LVLILSTSTGRRTVVTSAERAVRIAFRFSSVGFLAVTLEGRVKGACGTKLRELAQQGIEAIEI